MHSRIRHKLLRLEKTCYRRGLLSTRSMTLPTFLGIGAQKAGTTWLHRNLDAHPDVFTAEPKELHYFDRHFHTHPLRWYASFFEGTSKAVRGEVTPAYSILEPDRIAFIRAIMRDVRLLLFVRNPIDRAWSQACMNLLRVSGRTMAEVSDAEFYDHFASERSVSRGDYLRILESWRACFPDEQLFLGFFEEIAEDPEGLIRRVFGFLGLRTDVDLSRFPLREKHNRGHGIDMPTRFRERLVDMYAAEIERMHRALGGTTARWLASLEQPSCSPEPSGPSSGP